MRSLFSLLHLLILMTCVSAVLTAQQTQQSSALGLAEQRLQAATELTALSSVTSQPWHLKLDITSPDDTLSNPRSGIIEVWQSGNDSKIVYQYGGSVETILRSGGKDFYGISGSSIPDIVHKLLQQVLHPGPEDVERTGTKAEMKRQVNSGQPLDCIALTPLSMKPGAAPFEVFPNYCLAADSTNLRISYAYSGSEVYIRQAAGNFLGHQVTTKISVLDGNKEIAVGKLSALSTFTPKDDDFKPSADLKSAGKNMAKIPDHSDELKVIRKTPPVFPLTARMSGSGGIVELRVIIGRDGHVRFLRVMSMADADTALSSLVAVRQWHYQPVQLNGELVEVDTTTTISFAIGSRYPGTTR